MARRRPAFVLNAAEARHINIAHGLYPRQPLDIHTIARLAEALRAGAALSGGRTYAGGLVKFEPKEMERLMVPDLDTLQAMSLSPPRWTLDQLTEGAARGIEVFRFERLNEAREDYTSHFDEARSAIEDLLELSTDLTTWSGQAASILRRWLPRGAALHRRSPVSFDDLETLSGVTASDFAGGREMARPSLRRCSRSLTPVGSHGSWRPRPSETERHAAIVSTAAQIASRRIMTARANERKAAQEKWSGQRCRKLGFTEVAPRAISTLRTAPGPGEFCGESMLGSRKADSS